jgi:hypothetical protein
VIVDEDNETSKELKGRDNQQKFIHGWGEYANVHEDFIMNTMEVPNSFKVLKTLDICIGDSAASSHCTSGMIGATNRRRQEIMTQAMTGEAISSSSLVDIQMTACNKTGQIKGTVKMTDVSYILEYNFNMFSLSRCLQSGWKMTGGKSFIKAISPDGKQEILFNIVIQTPQGAIYANMMRQVLRLLMQE